MIKINKPLVVADSYEIRYEGHQVAKSDKGFYAKVEFGVYDTEGKRVDSKYLFYDETQYNDWWASFSTGTFLYEELKKKEDLSISPTEDSEQDFINVV